MILACGSADFTTASVAGETFNAASRANRLTNLARGRATELCIVTSAGPDTV